MLEQEIIVPEGLIVPRYLQEVSFGEPSSEVVRPQSLIEDRFPGVEESIAGVPFNNGVALKILPEEVVEGLVFDNDFYAKKREIVPGESPLVMVNVRLAPGAQVPDHGHMSGGELIFPLTPVVETRGIARLNGGQFERDESDRVRGAMSNPTFNLGRKPSLIGEQEIHGYQSALPGHYTDLLFMLPETHAKGTDKFVAVPTIADRAALKTRVPRK